MLSAWLWKLHNCSFDGVTGKGNKVDRIDSTCVLQSGEGKARSLQVYCKCVIYPIEILMAYGTDGLPWTYTSSCSHRFLCSRNPGILKIALL